jgi:endonuclease/exonuclease/phosphatase family metal-dependent hydrolase
LLLAFAAASSARFVAPEHAWGLQLAAPATPYLAWAVGVVLVGAAWNRDWVLLAVGALCWAAFALPPMLERRHAMPPAGSGGPALTVISFNGNLRYAGGKDREMEALLGEEEPHLLVLQEVPIRRRPDPEGPLGVRLVQPLFEKGFDPVWPHTPSATDIQQHTVGRLPVRGPLEWVFEPESDELWRSGGVNRAAYLWEGREFAVYNVHLHSFSENRPWQANSGSEAFFSPAAWAEAFVAYGRDYVIRARQARALKRVLDAETRPFLVCGDLNSTPYNWTYGHVGGGLRDAFYAAGRGWGMTFPASLPVVRIDYVFASREWRVDQAYVTRTISSDHLPVVARLTLPTRE